MKKQLEEAINMANESLDKIVSTPANRRLFEISDNAEELDNQKSKLFHSIVAKLLYICKRSRPDLETAVSFLCTRVSKCDIEDWKKLIRVLSYAKQTINDPRIIGVYSLKKLFSWIDASHAVHDDMKGHTGAASSFGIGVIGTKSTKQKLNTKSSTESELVGASEYLPYCIWYLNFLKEQGYPLDENIILQDNESAIRMERNGRNSCTGNSRHIHIRFFFIKDRIKNKEVKVMYCPTEHMLADFYTKPIQGTLFNTFRDVIMGYKKTSELHPPVNFEFEERVENNKVIPANLKNKVAYEVQNKRKYRKKNESKNQKNQENNISNIRSQSSNTNVRTNRSSNGSNHNVSKIDDSSKEVNSQKSDESVQVPYVHSNKYTSKKVRYNPGTKFNTGKVYMKV